MFASINLAFNQENSHLENRRGTNLHLLPKGSSENLNRDRLSYYTEICVAKLVAATSLSPIIHCTKIGDTLFRQRCRGFECLCLLSFRSPSLSMLFEMLNPFRFTDTVAGGP